jgi:hypothetical protein
VPGFEASQTVVRCTPRWLIVQRGIHRSRRIVVPMYRRVMLALAATSLSAACTASHARPSTPTSSPASNATLTGRLIEVGGPAPGLARPVPGSVNIDGPVSRHVSVGPDGKYAAALPVGTYTVTGAMGQDTTSPGGCRTIADTVTLAAGQAVVSDVVCSVK